VSPSPDSFSAYDELLAASPQTGAWIHSVGDTPVYAPDYELLGRLLTVPIAAGEVSESGRTKSPMRTNAPSTWCASYVRKTVAAGTSRQLSSWSSGMWVK